MSPFKSADLLLVYGSSPGDLHRFIHVFHKRLHKFVGYCLVGRSGSAVISSNPYCDDCLGSILSAFSVKAYNASLADYFSQQRTSNEALALNFQRLTNVNYGTFL